TGVHRRDRGQYENGPAEWPVPARRATGWLRTAGTLENPYLRSRPAPEWDDGGGAGLPRTRRAAARQDPGGKPLVDGKNVTGFTNGEEADVGLTKVVPFLVEDELLGLGAIYSKVKDWGVHTVKDGLLITGQNPASSGPAAKVLIDTLKAR